jgi:predicted  nucleic acid-binding Zn-ribbon protein
MRARRLILPVLTCLYALAGCAQGTGAPRDVVAPVHHTPETVQGLLDRHLSQLNASIDGLDDRMAEIKRTPDTPDPTIRELRALDLAGWQLHQQQWVLQREHLRFARAQLRRATEQPNEKPKIQQEWAKHEQEYEAALDEFRQQRHALEKKRLQVEAQLIDRYLR